MNVFKTVTIEGADKGIKSFKVGDILTVHTIDNVYSGIMNNISDNYLSLAHKNLSGSFIHLNYNDIVDINKEEEK